MLQIEVIGNIGSDAVVKDFNGQKYISFSVAHSDSYTDRQGQKHEQTTWVNCLKFGESRVIDYLRKGKKVFVRGELSARIYSANGGEPKVSVDCRVRDLQLLGGGDEAKQSAPAYNAPTDGMTAPSAEDSELPF